MSKEKNRLPFKVRYADADTRRIATIMFCTFAGGVLFAFIFGWFLAGAGGAAVLSSAEMRTSVYIMLMSSEGSLETTLKTVSAARPNKALQRTRLSSGCFPWRSVRAAERGRKEAYRRNRDGN